MNNTNKSNTCQTECKQGSYRSHDGVCKQCWNRRKQVLNAGVGFFFFKLCTLTSNSEAHPCVQKEAFAWTSNASSPCEFECTNQYTRAGYGAPVQTHVCTGAPYPCANAPGEKFLYQSASSTVPVATLRPCRSALKKLEPSDIMLRRSSPPGE